MNLIGVDIGGTFTDLVGYRGGELVLAKTLTTPANPTAGVATALELAHTQLDEIDEFLHGSTMAINTVLERKGARTALLTTEGFRDVYEIGRGNRPDAFDINFQRPQPLVPRRLRLEVSERLNARGEVLTPLDEVAVLALGRQLVNEGIEAVAVCFLHSYANPVHEALAGRLLRQAYPSLFVTLSHEILREFREYERTSTTVLNAYVGPRVRNDLLHHVAGARPVVCYRAGAALASGPV
jgi:N-methylhydantoinase A